MRYAKRKRGSKKARYNKYPATRGTNNSVIAKTFPNLIEAGPGTALRCIFSYVEDGIVLNPGAGSAATTIFRTASLFDPWLTGVGHQPVNFDQLMLIYQHYVVYGCRYKVFFNNTEVNSGGTAIVGVSVSDSPTAAPAGDWRIYAENGMCDWKYCAISGNDNITCLEGYVDNAKVRGVTRSSLFTDNTFRGNVSSDPADGVYLKIFASGINAADIGQINCTVQLTYYAVLLGGAVNSLS